MEITRAYRPILKAGSRHLRQETTASISPAMISAKSSSLVRSSIRLELTLTL